MRSNGSVFICGFMGAGKTTVAQSVARTLGWPAIDTDQHIEREADLSVAQIFAERGETHFRQLERDVVLRIARGSRQVVSLGGGALDDRESLAAILAHGTLVFLETSPGVLERRLSIAGPARPLLAGLSPAERTEKIRNLLDARRASYHRAAIIVNTDMLSPDQIALQIVEKL